MWKTIKFDKRNKTTAQLLENKQRQTVILCTRKLLTFRPGVTLGITAQEPKQNNLLLLTCRERHKIQGHWGSRHFQGGMVNKQKEAVQRRSCKTVNSCPLESCLYAKPYICKTRSQIGKGQLPWNKQKQGTMIWTPDSTQDCKCFS